MPYPFNATDYARAFRLRIRDPREVDYGQIVTYGRRWAQKVQRPDWSFYLDRSQWLTAVLAAQGLVASARGIVFGCGFGYLVDALHRRGFANVWGVDGSPYVEGRFDVEKDQQARVAFRDVAQMTRQEIAAALTQWTGDWHFDAIVTETLLEGYSDGVIATILDTLELALSSTNRKRLVHFVHAVKPEAVPYGVYRTDLGLRWQTLEAWAALRPTHTWIDWATGRVI